MTRAEPQHPPSAGRGQMSRLASSRPLVAASLVIGLAVLGATAYVLDLEWQGDSLGSILSVSALVLAMAFGSVGLISAARRTTGDTQRSWTWLAAGAVIYAVGELIFALQSATLGEPEGTSVSDLFWLGALPFWFVGLRARARAATRRSARGEGLLDALIIVGFFGIVIGRLLLHDLFTQDVPLDQALVGLAYPAADLALVWMLLQGIYQTDLRWDIEERLLVVGFLALMIGDLLWAGGTADSTAIADLGWIVTGLALGGAGFLASDIQRAGEGDATSEPPRSLLVDGMPYAAGIGVLVVAFWFDLSGEGDLALSLAAGGVLLLVYLRLALTVRQNRRLRKVAEERALLDPLTGLKNHRYFQERLEMELAGVDRNQSSVGLLMIDIDRFKDVNDTIGHLGGDRLLRDIGEVLRKNSRPYDVSCRVGGDEFAVILPGVLDDGLREVADRILEATAGIRLASSDSDGAGRLQISVSIGACLFPSAATDERELINNCDLALYQSKREGRGRVTVFEPGLVGPATPGEALADAEREIEKRERDLSRVFAAVADPLLVLGGDGSILDANPAACELAGLPVPEMQKLSILDFLDDQDKVRVVRLLEDEETSPVGPDEIEIVLPGGASHWVEFHAAEFPPDRVLLSLRDITDRRAAVAELALSEERFRALFENAGDAIYVIDDDGVIRDANNAAVELSGSSREELIGAKVDTLVSGGDRQEMGDLVEKFLTGSGGAQGIFEGTWPDGSHRAVQFSSVANFIPGRHLSIVRDVTEFVETLRAVERDQSGS